jgi:sulfur-carrier protein adenylyltransferase/sulfurtransferase
MPSPLDTLPTRAAGAKLSTQEVARYSRHLIMPEVGMEGQKRLKASSVLLIGAGGLGSPLGLYLAAAGVGRIGLVDFDVVDFSNLQRQVLHSTNDVGRPKLQSAKDRLQAINPEVRLDLYETRLSSANAFDILRPYDIVIDGTDNFPTRYLVNDACVLLNKPNVYGSIFRFEGQASVFYPGRGPCYRCLYPEPPPPGEVPSCAEGGVLGILPGLIGCIQATEAVKLLLGQGSPLVGRLLLYDALQMSFREFKVRRNPKCPLCGDNATIKQLIDYEQFCGVRGQEALAPASANEITVEELKQRMDRREDLFILDVRNPEEYQICKIAASTLIPLPSLPQRFRELDPDRELIVHCKSGMRSAKAIQFLREQGFRKLVNLRGGILAWAERIDPTMPKY